MLLQEAVKHSAIELDAIVGNHYRGTLKSGYDSVGACSDHVGGGGFP